MRKYFKRESAGFYTLKADPSFHVSSHEEEGAWVAYRDNGDFDKTRPTLARAQESILIYLGVGS